MRILLVEDEEDLGFAIKQVLVGEKYIMDWVPMALRHGITWRASGRITRWRLLTD